MSRPLLGPMRLGTPIPPIGRPTRPRCRKVSDFGPSPSKPGRGLIIAALIGLVFALLFGLILFFDHPRQAVSGPLDDPAVQQVVEAPVADDQSDAASWVAADPDFQRGTIYLKETLDHDGKVAGLIVASIPTPQAAGKVFTQFPSLPIDEIQQVAALVLAGQDAGSVTVAEAA